MLRSTWTLQGCTQECFPRDASQRLVPSSVGGHPCRQGAASVDISGLPPVPGQTEAVWQGPRWKQTFSLIPTVSMHSLLWFKVPGLQRHVYQTDIPRARGSLPVVPAGRVLNREVQGLGSPGTPDLTLKVPEILYILLKTVWC